LVNFLKFEGFKNAIARIRIFVILYRFIVLPVGNFFLNILLFILGYRYNSSGLISNRNCDFLNDPKFKKAYAAGLKQWPDAKGGEWTFHLNFWAVEHAIKLDGDFVECGVFRAKTTMANVTYLNFQSLRNKKYFLFDTFSGLDPKFSSKDELEYWKNHYPDTYDFVKKSFRRYPNVKIIRGTVPNSLKTVKIDKVAYLHIDLNSVIPERKTLEFFWPKLVSGGIIVLDDYSSSSVERDVKQKNAHDDFAKSVGVTILNFPGGQGVLIKP
jgi:O-methyltransferase